IGRLQTMLVRWNDEGIFDEGNGDKILKRIINIITRYKGEVDADVMRQCLSLRPNLRDTIYRHMSMTSPNVRALELVLDYLEGEYVVDDASFVDFATYFVESCVKLSPRLLRRIFGLIDRMIASKQEALLFAAFTMLSKIGDEATIARQ